jgi:hypothetical protein
MKRGLIGKPRTEIKTMSERLAVGVHFEMDVTPWWWESAVWTDAVSAGLAAGLNAAPVMEWRANRNGLIAIGLAPVDALVSTLKLRRDELRKVIEAAGEPFLPECVRARGRWRKDGTKAEPRDGAYRAEEANSRRLSACRRRTAPPWVLPVINQRAPNDHGNVPYSVAHEKSGSLARAEANHPI